MLNAASASRPAATRRHSTFDHAFTTREKYKTRLTSFFLLRARGDHFRGTVPDMTDLSVPQEYLVERDEVAQPEREATNEAVCLSLSAPFFPPFILSPFLPLFYE